MVLASVGLGPLRAQATITEIIDATGDGAGNILDNATGVAADGAGNIYVTGYVSFNVFRITPGGVITEIIDATGDGAGNALGSALAVAVDGAGNVYVAGGSSNNAFKISTPGTCSTSGTPCTITEIIDATGDGAGNTLNSTWSIAVDGAGNVYVTGYLSDNAFKITPGGVITAIITATGDGGVNTLDGARGIAVDDAGKVFVVGDLTDNVFRIIPPNAGVEIMDATGDGAGNILDGPWGVAADPAGNVFVAGGPGNNAFRITASSTCKTSGTPCTITEIIDAAGDGAGKTLGTAADIAVNDAGNVFVAGALTDNAFKINFCGNGEVEGVEQCDDGNTTADGNCCAADCSFEPAATACGDPSDTACDDPDSCDGAGTCNANLEAPGFPCGDQGVDCHVDDACNGAGACIDNGFEPVATACGDPSDTACDDPDSCDGAGTCNANFEPPGFPCADGAFCNGDETCNGAGTCDAGTPVNCDDADICTDDSCNEATDQCDNVFDVLNDPSCATCGDGLIEGLEGCDDANTAPGDGCDESCQVEPGYACTGEPSVCGPSSPIPALSVPGVALYFLLISAGLLLRHRRGPLRRC